MTFNAVLGTQHFAENQVVDRTHPAIILSMLAIAAAGIINEGQIVAKSTSGIMPFGNFSESVGTGDGTTTLFNYTTAQAPVYKGSILITDGTSVISDDGNGNLVGDGDGSVNYAAGTISASFTAAPANAAAVTLTYNNVPIGVSIDTVDTAQETVVPVEVHGTVVAEKCLTGANPSSAEDLEKLQTIGVYAI